MQDTEKEAKGTGHHQNGLSLLSASPSVPTSCCSYCRMVFSTWWKQELWEPQSCTSYDLNHPVDISIIVSLVPSLKITRKYAHGCSLGEELYMASLTVIVLKKKKKKETSVRKRWVEGGDGDFHRSLIRGSSNSGYLLYTYMLKDTTLLRKLTEEFPSNKIT